MVEEERKTKKKAAPKAKAIQEEKKAEVQAKAETHAQKAETAPEQKAEAKAEPQKAPESQKPADASKHEKKEPKARKKGSPKKEARKVFVVRGKRKVSIARATISAGKGVIRLNSLNINAINNHYIREIIAEPLRYIGPEANNVNISITVRGGGVMGQAQAARTAIANALAKYFDGMNLREKFLAIDKSLIIEDTRRVETKKFRGPKARARFQKSYR